MEPMACSGMISIKRLASEYYLYGDAFRAPDVVKKVRTSIRTRRK
jgi:hypothetical protein